MPFYPAGTSAKIFISLVKKDLEEGKVVVKRSSFRFVNGKADHFAIDDNEMRFGPIGIAKKERNKGIGSILLEYALDEMAKRGIYRMYFLTTDEAGKRYYERRGLKIIRTFTAYKKQL